LGVRSSLICERGANVAFTYLPEEETDARETVQAIEEEGREALSISGDIQEPEFLVAQSSRPSAASVSSIYS